MTFFSRLSITSFEVPLKSLQLGLCLLFSVEDALYQSLHITQMLLSVSLEVLGIQVHENISHKGTTAR